MLFIHVDLPSAAIATVQVQYVKICFRSAPIKDSIGDALPLASIIKIPPVGDGGDLSYNELVCTEKDKQNIAFIIQTMAENGKLALLFRKSELNRIGAEINHVHPFKFLGVIFSNDHLKACMREIYEDYFKWNGFMDGLGPSLTNQFNQSRLSQYLEAFAAEARVLPQDIAGYIQSKDWENMVRYLMIH